jgi:hypothetical protein
MARAAAGRDTDDCGEGIDSEPGGKSKSRRTRHRYLSIYLAGEIGVMTMNVTKTLTLADR